MSVSKDIYFLEGDRLVTFGARTDRPFEHYEKVFKLESDFKGKVLDIGAGDSNFSEIASKDGIEVISVDASYTNEPPELVQNAISAKVQSLPFKNDTFDQTLASHSLIYISKSEGLAEAICEMIRVTKPGGKIKISPVIFENQPNLPNFIRFIHYDIINSLTLEITKISAHNIDWPSIINDLVNSVRFRTHNNSRDAISQSTKYLGSLSL